MTQPTKEQKSEGLTTSRVETLSDGVFAIVMTLMVLDIKVPVPVDGTAVIDLTQRILHLLPRITTYAIAFIILGFFWMAHHLQFQYFKRSDRNLLWINILFLMTIAFIPFTTYLLHEYPDHRLSVIIFGTNMIASGLMLYLNWSYASTGHRLIDKDLDSGIIKIISWKCLLPLVVYVIVVLVSFINVQKSTYFFLLVPILQPSVGRYKKRKARH